ncbi:hypothetical protein ACJMK2_004237 [Sinanodonta woodiana]|uniref:Uncharacterized protein n=1 Tax=Sinanodonta woodiana TaxID=1069815 RepID=A0ABD3Y304_SINWO
MSNLESYKYVYSVLFIISSSIFNIISEIEVQTTGTLKTSNLMKNSGKADAFKQRRPMVDTTNEYATSVKEHKLVNSMLELDLPAYGSDVLVVRNVEIIRNREVNDILNNEIDLTTTVEPSTLYEGNEIDAN